MTASALPASDDAGREVIERQAKRDLLGVLGLRNAIRERLGWKRVDERTIEGEEEFIRQHVEYLGRQERVVATLLSYRPLYRVTRDLVGDRFKVRAFYSPSGEVFTAVDGGGDDVLVSWAHPIFAAVRQFALGERVRLDGRCPYDIVAATTVESEAEDALQGVKVILPGRKAVRVDRVAMVNGKPTVIEPGVPSPTVAAEPVRAEPVVAEPVISAAVESELMDIFADETTGAELPLTGSTAPARSFGLSSKVSTSGGKDVEIPFALDEVQLNALTSRAGSGPILLVGPPGTGKTTIALLRATMFRHSLLKYDDRGRADAREAQEVTPSVRVFVVTEHLTNYLREFLCSRESALPDAKVTCLRGAFVEEFLRDSFFARWLDLPGGGDGAAAWFDPAADKTSDTGHLIKAQPKTLALVYSKALERARVRAADQWEAVVGNAKKAAARVAAFEAYRDALGAAGYQEAIHGVSSIDERRRRLHERVIQGGKNKAFESGFKRRTESIDRHVTALRYFLDGWLKAATERCETAIKTPEQVPLGAAMDDLLLGRFERALNPTSSEAVDRSFVAEVWQRLERLIEPRRVLADVAAALEASPALTQDSGIPAVEFAKELRIWRTRLEDRNRPFVRSDFPLIAALARTFYAAPPPERARPSLTDLTLGFRLPGNFVRFDHVIVDEAQDLTWPELLLVTSFVEPERCAYTVSGDPRQRMHWRAGARSLEALQVPTDRSFTVRRNYRQTPELCDWLRTLSRRLFPAEADTMEQQDERRGPPPAVRLGVGDLAACAAVALPWVREWYADDRGAIVAVLTVGMTEDDGKTLASEFRRGLESSYVMAEFVPDGRMLELGRVAVSPVPTVKGLEFDGVVLVVGRAAAAGLSRDGVESLVLRNQVYVGASRAKKWLGVVSEEAIPLLDITTKPR